MIYTSYFGKLKKLPANVVPIAICGKSPEWFGGAEYKKLAPKYSFFSEWKKTKDNDYYIKCFNDQVLKTLKPDKVVNELYTLLDEDAKYFLNICNCPPWNNPNLHIALLCYEKPGDFCHRNLVAEWLNKNGYEVKEFNDEL